MWKLRLLGRLLLVILGTTTWAHTLSVPDENSVQPMTKNTYGPCLVISPTEVTCDGIQSFNEVWANIPEELWQQVTTLTIRNVSEGGNWTRDHLVNLPSIQTITFNHSFFANWKLPRLPNAPNLTSLILDDCWNRISLKTPNDKPTLSLTTKALQGVGGLDEFHIINCFILKINFTSIEAVKPLKQLYVVGGGFNCTKDKIWMLDWMENGRANISGSPKCFVIHSGEMIVFSTLYSFNDNEFLLCMQYWRETVRDCPSVCECKVQGFKDTEHPIIHLICERAGLQRLPEVIPRHSTRMQFGWNNISDISPLFTNERYRRMDSILLNNNQISYMDGELFYNYIKDRPLDVYFNLASNNLTMLPLKEINRIYENAREAQLLYTPTFALADNPWNCDNCSFLPDFQKLVYYQSSTILDYQDIRCPNESEHLRNTRLVMIDVDSQCSPEPPLLSSLDILNIALAVLLLLLIFNFLHNFYQYRRHGKLPWIIIRMPCC